MKDLFCYIETKVITKEHLINTIKEIVTKNNDIREQKIEEFNKRNYGIKIKNKTRRSSRKN